MQKDQGNDKLVGEIFRILAKIHAMEFPIKRNTNWLFEVQSLLLKTAFEKFSIDKEIEENDCQFLKDFDFKAEMDWCCEVCEKSKSFRN